MSEWLQRIEAHPVRQRLQDLKNLLSQLEPNAEWPSDAVTDIDRLRVVSRHLDDILASVDPLLVPPAVLNNLDAPLQKLAAEVEQFRTNNNRAHLASANGHADSVLGYALNLPAPQAASQLEGAREAVGSLRRSAGQYVRALEEEKEGLRTQIQQLTSAVTATTTEVSAQKARLDTAIADYQKQFSAAESTRRDEFVKMQSAARLELEELMKQHRSTLDTAIDEAQEALTERQAEATRQFEAVTSDLKAKSRDVLDEMQAHLAQAQNLLHVIGSTGMAGEYQKAANAARRMSLIWQCIAAVSMMGLIAFAVLVYVATQDTEIKWGAVGARVFVAVTFGVLAAYGARQGDKYGDAEIVNRRHQLELSSIDPYLVNMPEELRHKVKEQLAARLFGNPAVSSARSRKEVSGSVLDIIRMLVEMLNETAKKG